MSRILILIEMARLFSDTDVSAPIRICETSSWGLLGPMGGMSQADQDSGVPSNQFSGNIYSASTFQPWRLCTSCPSTVPEWAVGQALVLQKTLPKPSLPRKGPEGMDSSKGAGCCPAQGERGRWRPPAQSGASLC